MNGANENRVTLLLCFVSVGFLVSIGCQGASPPTAIAVACPGAQHENPDESEILRCCERRVVSRLRAACVSEALHGHGVCAQHPVLPPDAGFRDASRDLGMPRDAGPRDSGHDMSAPHDASARDASLDLRASGDANQETDAGIGGCGDGIVEAGEQCDPPRTGGDGLQCGPDCHYLTCGNGVIDPGEQCDPPRSLSGPVSQGYPPLCTQSCQIPTCGNQVLDPGEQCDPPDGLTCNAQCQTIPTVCGDGIIQPGETCDFTNGQFCLNCQITACGRCFFASLGPQNVNSSNTDFACQALTGTARTTCQALLACMTANFSNCITSQLALHTACYCSDATCSAGVNGRCVAQINAVAGTNDPTVILGELNDQTSLLSQVRAEAQRFSTSSCGFTCSQLIVP
jgi:hypothetical protein